MRGLFRELYACEAETPVAYTRDWSEASGREAMLDGARRHLLEVADGETLPGDVLLFRIRRDSVAKHAAVLASPCRIIHAYEGAGAVVETPFSPWWRRRVAGAFRFDLPHLIRPIASFYPSSLTRRSMQWCGADPGPCRTRCCKIPCRRCTADALHRARDDRWRAAATKLACLNSCQGNNGHSRSCRRRLGRWRRAAAHRRLRARSNPLRPGDRPGNRCGGG